MVSKIVLADNMIKVIHLPINYDLKNIDGAYLRSLQVNEYLQKAKITNLYQRTISLPEIYQFFKTLGSVTIIYHIFMIFFKYGLTTAELLKLILIIARFNRLEICSQTKIYVEYGPGLSRLLALYLMMLHNKNTVILPHNVEFLACVGSSSKALKHQTKLFQIEQRILSLAAEIITISQFDRDVINALRKDDLCWCLPFEDKRQITEGYEGANTKEDYFLYLGTFTNPPSFASAENLCRAYCHPFKLFFIGNGSQLLSTSGNIESLGRVSDGELIELIKGCKALIVYQLPTSGFLTRLIFLIKFQKPIFINSSYSQSKEISYEKLIQFSTLEDLNHLLKAKFNL